MEINNKLVGRRIKQLRLSLGLTLEEFGKKFNTSKATVYNWEVGRNLPNKENLKVISNIAEITVNELLYGSKEEYITKVISKYSEELGIPINQKALDQTILKYTLTSYLRNEYESPEIIEDFYAFSLTGGIKELTKQDYAINAIALKNELERMIKEGEIPDNETSKELLDATVKQANEILESMNEKEYSDLVDFIKNHSKNN